MRELCAIVAMVLKVVLIDVHVLCLACLVSNMSSKGTATQSEIKAFRLASLGREAYVSKSGIEKLFKGIHRDGLPDAYDRSAQYRARKGLCSTETPYGRLVNTTTLTCTHDARTQLYLCHADSSVSGWLFGSSTQSTTVV